MSGIYVLLLLGVAVTEGYNCVDPIPANVTAVGCYNKGLTKIPVLPTGAVIV